MQPEASASCSGRYVSLDLADEIPRPSAPHVTGPGHQQCLPHSSAPD